MRIHCFQHVPFEDLETIGVWAKKKGFSVQHTRFFEGFELPPLESFDCLIVMGGPMSTYEEAKFPWLVQEKKIIEQAISSGKRVLGICLGAQLIANVLGARVYPNRGKEIGWFPVRLTPAAQKSKNFFDWPDSFMSFHWHGDTFDLPKGCLHIAESDACRHQAFEYNGRVVGLQFHLESTGQSIDLLLRHCTDEVSKRGKYIQSVASIRQGMDQIPKANQLLQRFLNNLIQGPIKTSVNIASN